MGNDVWVLVDRDGGDASRVTFEMLDEGRTIANRLRGTLIAVVFGHQLPDLAKTLSGYGADSVWVVDHPLLADYTTDVYSWSLVELIKERQPFLVLLSATANGRDLAPRVARRIGAALVSDCTMVTLNATADAVHATRPTHRDKVYTVVALTPPPPFLATFRPGALGVRKPDLSRQAIVEIISLRLDSLKARTRVLQTRKADPATVDIAEAEIVVAGGRGLGGLENWQLVQDLADALGASVAGSRMTLDAGWIPRERLVGQTGKSISPRLYLALGISGAKEHVFGIREAKAILAINTDPGAAILKLADKAVVGDVKEIVPILVRKLASTRS